MTHETVSFELKRALLSVSDKCGIVELARALEQQGVEMVATSRTANLLRENGFLVVDVSTYTGFPELLHGRVKTLHPAVHAGLLASTEEDRAALQKYQIVPFDLLVVNLYPFERTTQNKNSTLEEAMEHIDIGGSAMLRAAAKNHQHVAVIVHPEDYSVVIPYMKEKRAPAAFRMALAQKAFAYTTHYDAHIADYFNRLLHKKESTPFLKDFMPQYQKKYDLRYGENPHQRAALYVDSSPQHALARAECIQGKKLSYNNVLDAHAAWTCARDFSNSPSLCVIVKHGNPCGVAQGDTQLQAYQRAFETDPNSCYGGIVAFNQCVQAETVTAILKQQFVEVVIAPTITDEARHMVRTKENIRVLLTGAIHTVSCGARDIRSIDGGCLVQDSDQCPDDPNTFRTVTTLQPNHQQTIDLIFAWKIVKHVQSNAIVLVHQQATVGIGGGQSSRIMSARIALWQAEDHSLVIEGAVMASDAFIPFSDVIELAHQKGIAALIQPGGSINDEKMIRLADELGMIMIFTEKRHFKH